jgi:menaquinone-dependent protoporphyrinogen oxidase
MRILVAYGSTEGHTSALSEFVAARLTEAGHEVIVSDTGRNRPLPQPRNFDAAVLASSLHVGRYQASLVDYARTHHESLNAMPSAFISVSLSAAGENPDDWEGLETCLARFLHETGWKPKAIHHAGGAIRYSQYDFFKRLALKYIAARRGQKTVTSRDYDFTDYEGLKAFVAEFVSQAKPSPPTPSSA